ncbi:MAG: hypothetical protein JNL26_14050 [Gemmatimonadetes bacterium]|nr:hypothetical protein [Gemmatimonadota bacterium]
MSWSLRWISGCALAMTAACATASRHAIELPARLVSPVSGDSALRMVRTVLLEAHYVVDGDPLQDGLRTLTTSRVLRRGGLGETVLVFRFHAAPDVPGASGSRLTFDVTAEERGRVVSIGVDNPRDPRQLRGQHALNPNDREAQGLVKSLLDALAQRGIHPVRPDSTP